ncbi:ABC-type transport system involved in resistance to organic solvents, periplasmic component [Polaromonas sp. CG9_12]|uniref:MlaD family protein n=1 Tax=Polaromonas sp. CG_9.11 TaxID=2787730 RepID=UPI0004DDD5CB|nr:MlaD family protein [Polaromonas sp. CG_9.11]MBG6075666.1 phospholipid/cholesterol/gamma-HCH transport system substrate-binding protein [Polaromonas sp. CG_9.11]CDS52533.1 ABC-type transport system involved in resistance to organic solvents, periplasmic component [Polaromonas sp. CG9_12]
MENKAHALIAGAFVVLVTALLALLAIWLTRDNTARNLYEMSTSETVSGLQPQATVRYRGVAVGKVERIGFDQKVKGNVLIRVSIDEAAPVTRSTFATVASQGVTGLGFIQLDDDGSSAQRLAPNDDDPPRIPLKQGGLDKLLKQGEVIFDQAEQVTTRINQLLSAQNEAAINTAVTQLAEAAGSINRVAKALEPAVATLPALSRDAQATLRSVKTATDEVTLTARRLNEKGGALDRLKEGGEALAAGVETFSAATLPKLGEVADETARTMRQLRRTVNAVDDNPQALIFGNGPAVPGPGEAGFSANGDRP